MKKILLLLLLCICFLSYVNAQTETEPNDTWNLANTIVLGATGSGTTDAAQGSDWWRVSTPGDGLLTVNFTSTNGLYMWCEVYDTLGTIQVVTAANTNGSNVQNINGLAKGTYYIRFYAYTSGQQPTYTFIPTFTASSVANDAEPDSTVAQAQTLALNGSGTGHNNYYFNNHRDTVDFKKITTNADGDLAVTVTSNNSQYIWFQIIDGNGTTVLSSNNTNGTFTQTVNGLLPGVYYVKLYSYYPNGFIDYTISNTLTTPVIANDIEPNGTVAQAEVLSLDGSVTGHNNYYYNGFRDTVDYYKVTTNADGDLRIRMTSNNGQYIWVQILDGDGTTQFLINNTNSTLDQTVTGLAPGTYYIKVYAYYTSTGYIQYTLADSLFKPATPIDAEPNGTAAQADVMPLNGSVTGHLNYYYNGVRDTTDYFKVTTNVDGDLSVTLTSNNGQYTYFQIIDGNGTTVLISNNTNGTLTQTVAGLLPGTYYVKLFAYYTSSGYPNYTLSNTLTPAPLTNDVEFNNTIATAQVFNPNSTITGHSNYYYNGYRDSVDVFAITTTADGSINLNITSQNGQFIYVQLFDHDGTTSLGVQNTNGTINVFTNRLAAGTYYVKVFPYYTTSGYVPYTLTNVADYMNFVHENPSDNSDALHGTLLPANTNKTGTIYYYYNHVDDVTDWWQIGYDGTGTMALHIDEEQNHANTDYPYINYALYLDTLGSPVSSGQLHAATNTINLTGLSIAKYYLRLTTSFSTFGAYQLNATYTERCANVVAINSSTQLAGCNGNISYGISGGLPAYTVQLYKDGSPSGAPQIVDNTNTITFTNLGVGTYYLRSYSFGGSGSCNNVSGNTVFAIPATPTISAGGATTFCQGGSVTLTSSAAASYLWSTGATTQSIVVTASGNYSVTAYNAAGCASLVSATTTVTVNPLPATPTISAGGATTFCQGGSVTLTASAATSYLWSNGATTQAITASASGSYSVTVKNANGCSSAASAATTVTVNPLPATPTISAGGATTFCQGGNVTLTSSAATSYLWSNGATTQSITVNASGSYSVTVKNANGCSSAPSAATTVTVNPLPTVTLSAFTAVCSTDAAFTLSGGSPAGGTYSGTGVSGGQFNPATAGVGTFPITYSYTNANGCTATAIQSITVNNCTAPCNASITAGGPTTFCQGGNVTLTASVGEVYSWSNGASSQSITVSTGGSYTVTVTDANNCTATSPAVVVTVNALPAVPTISAGGATTFCQGGSVTLTSSVASSYLWSTNATTQSITVNSAGSYTVTVKNAAGCTATSAPTVIAVNPLPVTPTISASGATTFCAGGSVTLTSSATTNNVWSTGATTQSINVTAAGSYTVTVTNASNCSGTSAATVVTVNPLPTVTLASFNAVCSTDAVFTLTGGSPAGGTYSGTGVSAGQFNPATAGVGTFNITYSYTNANSCTATATKSITVNNCTGVCTATISVDKPTTFCQGGNVVLTSSPAAAYSWSNGATTQSITVTTSGNYTVTTTNAAGCMATSAATVVTVNPLPATPTIAAGGATTFCQGGSVTLTSSAASSYLWSNGATTQSVTVNASGNYSVTVKNAAGCSASSAATVITVNPLPATPTISAGGPTTFCTGGSVVLTSSAATNNLWSNGASTQSITVTASGSYTVKVTNANGCSATSAATVVTANNCNGAYCSSNGSSKNKGYISNVFLRTIFNTTGYSAGGYGDYTNQSTSLNKRFDYVISVTPGYGSLLNAAPLYTRVWIDWNQDGDFNDPGELVFAPAGSSYFLRIGVINPPNSALNGSTRMRVAVSATGVPPNCGSIAYGEVEDYTIVVGNGNWYRTAEPVEEPPVALNESFNLYPNPVSEELVIQRSTTDNSKVIASTVAMQIADANGRVVMRSTLTRSTEVIDVRRLPSGIYFVQLKTNSGITTKKIIVSH